MSAPAAVKAEQDGAVAEIEVAFGGGFQAREHTHDTVDRGRGTLGDAAIEFCLLSFGDGVALRAVSRSVQPARAKKGSRPSDNRPH